MDYFNFDLQLTHNHQACTAHVLDSPVGTATHHLSPPSDPDIERALLRLGQAGQRTNSIGSPEAAALYTAGLRLFSELFGGNVATNFYTSLAHAQSQEHGLRIRLLLDPNSPLATLPWEHMNALPLNRFLALSRTTPLLRYHPLPVSPAPLETALPLRVLLVLANPSNYPLLNTAGQQQQLVDEMRALIKQRLVRIDTLAAPTFPALMQQLQGEAYHIVQYSGHCTLCDDGTHAVLLEDEHGGPCPISGRVLGAHLAETGVRLLCLNSAHTSAAPLRLPMTAVAYDALRGGLPAVVANLFELSGQAASRLACELYRALCNGYGVDVALTEARKALYNAGNHLEWGSAALFLGVENPKLFVLRQAIIGYRDHSTLQHRSTAQSRSVHVARGNALDEPATNLSETYDLLQGRYEIEELLGQGGFGAVYRARDHRLKRTVAIKETFHHSADFVRQFEREASMLASLKHPAITGVIDYFTEDEQYYLVMDYIAGDDLSQYLAAQPHAYLSETDALHLIEPIIEALDYLHTLATPIIHRDIKPGNIRIAEHGQVYLVDFGIAKIYDSDMPTTVGARALTPGFSPLEQYGSGSTDPRSDLYALGATLYMMLTGQRPPEATLRVATENDPLLPVRQLNAQISPQLEAIVQRLMSVTIESRYPDAATLLAQVRALRNNPDAVSLESIQGRPNITRVAAPEAQDAAPRELPEPQPTARSSLLMLSLLSAALLVSIWVLGPLLRTTALSPAGQAQQAVLPAQTETAQVALAASGIAATAQVAQTSTAQVLAARTSTAATAQAQQQAAATATAAQAQQQAAATATAAQAQQQAAATATAATYSEERAALEADRAARVARHGDGSLALARARLAPDVEEAVLNQGYTANVVFFDNLLVLRSNQLGAPIGVWARDLDYALRGFSYTLNDMAVLRTSLEVLLNSVRDDGVVPEVHILGQAPIYDTTWDPMPNLIHGVYTYVAKTGDLEFYRANRDKLQRVGQWVLSLDTNGDSLPDNNIYPAGYYNSVENSTLHTYAIAHFYATLGQLAELDAAIGLPAESQFWAERAAAMRAAFHQPFTPDPAAGGGYWIEGLAWPIAWYRPDEPAVERLETFGIFEALYSNLIGPQDGTRYTTLLASLEQQLPALLDQETGFMRLMLRGYERDMRRTDVDPAVPLWHLDPSAPWITGIAAPAYAAAGYPIAANTLVEGYNTRVRSGQLLPLLAAGANSAYGQAEALMPEERVHRSDEQGTAWGYAAWYMAVYGGHYGLRLTPRELVVAPRPFRDVPDDGINDFSYQGAQIQLQVDCLANTYRLQVDRATPVQLWPMLDQAHIQVNGSAPVPGPLQLMLQPGQEYVVTSTVRAAAH